MVACSMELIASLESLCIVLMRVPICLAALPERSASRCTSSAITAKPCPALSACIAAFNESILVCSAAVSYTHLTLPTNREV